MWSTISWIWSKLWDGTRDVVDYFLNYGMGLGMWSTNSWIWSKLWDGTRDVVD